MRKSLVPLTVLMACCAVLSSVSGCMSRGESLVGTGVLKLEKVNAGKVYIVWSDAHEQETGFVVSGVVKRRDRVGLPIKTCVSVSIVAPDGTVIAEQQSAQIHVPRQRTRKGQSPKRFAVHFSQTAPRGSLIRVEVPARAPSDAT
jgi:hypothetical protein